MVTPASRHTLSTASAPCAGARLPEDQRLNCKGRSSKGVCCGCGVKTHTVSMFKKAAVTSDAVYQGTCIRCHPTQVPPLVLQTFLLQNDNDNKTSAKQTSPLRRRLLQRLKKTRSPVAVARVIESETVHPLKLLVQGSSVPGANGEYAWDVGFRGAYRKYRKQGMLDDQPVSFLFHRSATRWFLSAQLANGGRVYLYCAPAASLECPPTCGPLGRTASTTASMSTSTSPWKKMNDVAGSASIHVTASPPAPTTALPPPPPLQQVQTHLSATLRIRVVTSTQQEFFVDMDSNATIVDLKTQIQFLRGIPVRHLQLQCPRHGAVTDTHSLRHYLDEYMPTFYLHYPPKYPCRRLYLRDQNRGIHKLHVAPCDTLLHVRQKIKNSSWFSQGNSEELQFISEETGLILADDNQSLAQLDLCNLSILQLLTPPQQHHNSTPATCSLPVAKTNNNTTTTANNNNNSSDLNGTHEEAAVAKSDNHNRPDDKTVAHEPPVMASSLSPELMKRLNAAKAEQLERLRQIQQQQLKQQPLEYQNRIDTKTKVVVESAQPEIHPDNNGVDVSNRVSAKEILSHCKRSWKLNSGISNSAQICHLPYCALPQNHAIADTFAVGTTQDDAAGTCDTPVKSVSLPNIQSPILAPNPALVYTQPIRLATSPLDKQLSALSVGSIVAGGQTQTEFVNRAAQAWHSQSRLLASTSGQIVPLGAIPETEQHASSDEPKSRPLPEGNMAQFAALTEQYLQDELANTYHRAFVDAMYATLTVMKMHFYGLGLPGPGIAGRLIPTPSQPGGLLVYTVGEMLATIKDRRHGLACIDLAGQFLEAMPLAHGESVFVARLSCTMLRAQMQRRHNSEIDRALAAYESTVEHKSLGCNIAEEVQTGGVSAILERWLEEAKRRARHTGCLEQVLPINNNPATAAAIVHVGLVTRAIVENSRTLICLKVEATPEDVASSVVKLMEISLANGAEPVLTKGSAQAYVTTKAFDDMSDPTTTLNLLLDVENMTNRLERFEQENVAKQTNAQVKLQTASAGMGQLAVGIPMESDGATTWSGDIQVVVQGRDPTIIDAQRAELLSEYNQRIGQLEARLAAYDEQFAPLLESMASAAKQSHNGIDARRRIDLAHKILRGETQSARKLVDFGYQLIAGKFENNHTP
jgi:hypothetical protein